MVDPNLNYNQGGFEGDEANDSFYQSLLDEDLNEIDFSSQEALKNRQKEILARI